MTMLISELRGIAGNLPGVYRAFGIEPTDYKIAVLKTASNFQYFAPITSAWWSAPIPPDPANRTSSRFRGRGSRGRFIRSTPMD